MSIGDNIKHARKNAGISQEKLAEMLKIKQVSISRWERGEHQPSLEMVTKICRALSVSADVILGLTEGNKITKYELSSCSIEISWKNRDKIKPGCTTNQDSLDETLIATYLDKESAINDLKHFKTEINQLSGTASGIYYHITEYYVREMHYVDNEFIDGGDIWEFSKMKLPKMIQ